MRLVFINENGGTLATQESDCCPHAGDLVSFWSSERQWVVRRNRFVIQQNAHDSHVRVICGAAGDG